MPPSSKEIFGSLEPIPPDKLENDEVVYRKLADPELPFAIQQRLINGRMQTVYRNLPDSMRDFWVTSSQAFAKRQYLVFTDGEKTERYTYADMHSHVRQASTLLQRNFQIRKGDRIGIAARNYPEFMITFWAIHMLGAVACVLNSFHDGETLAFSIRDVDCRLVVCDGERLKRLEAYHSQLFASDSLLEALVVLPWHGTKRVSNRTDRPWLSMKSSTGPHRIHDWQDLVQELSKDGSKQFVDNVQIMPEDHAVMLFTSGTTGKPKGVLSTQRQFLSCLRLATFGPARTLLRRRRPLPPPPDPSSMDQGSLLILVPLTHTTGLQSGVLLSTAAGSKCVLMPTYKKQQALEVAIQEDVRGILGIGFMIRELTLAASGRLPNLGTIAHGGSSAAKEIPSEVRQHLSDAVMSAGYGLTEVNGVAAHILLDDYIARPTSIGKPPLGVELMLVNVDDKIGMTPILESDKQGELWIRSPGVALGYWNRPKDNAETFMQDGWFRTGDLATRDKEGFYYVTSRLKDIIVRKGENIACTHVEQAANAHPAILESCAIGIPDTEAGGGEQVGVVCITKDDVSGDGPSEEEILQVMRKHLPKYAVPEYVWIRRSSDDLPRNPSGKTLRNEVQKDFVKYLEERAGKGSSKKKSKL